MMPEQAKQAYRAAWAAWQATTDPEARRQLELRMDALQPFITEKPGPEWKEFAASLPGYLEYWIRSLKALIRRRPYRDPYTVN